MKSKHFLFVFLLQVAAFSVQAARVDTVFVKSPSMNKDVTVSYTHLTLPTNSRV